MFIIAPFIAIRLNQYFGLPVFNNIILKITGIVLILLEIVLSGHTFYFFLKYGRGNPIITEPTKKFVERGLYKYVRNPMYLGHISATLGIFFLFGHLLLMLNVIILFVLINLIVILWEEPNLRKKFGKEYIDFTKRVKRWGIF